MPYKEGELWRGPDGKVAIFDRDWFRNSGQFVKRLNLRPVGHASSSGWDMEPVAGLEAEIMAANARVPPTTAANAPIPVSDLVASGAIKPAPRPSPPFVSRSQPPTPHANDDFGRDMARRGATTAAKEPTIDAAAIYAARRKQAQLKDGALPWAEIQRREKDRRRM
jgi:hypothetical protein